MPLIATATSHRHRHLSLQHISLTATDTSRRLSQQHVISHRLSATVVSHRLSATVVSHRLPPPLSSAITVNWQGFIISDWLGIDRITEPSHVNYTYSVETSVNAGIDMIMGPYNDNEVINTLNELVHKKAISMSRIDDAVTRILRVKFAMGLFENPMGDPSLAKELGSKAHRELAREAVRKSLVILKNGNYEEMPVIPLPKKARKILVAGTHADNLGYQCGGWTISWQGNSGNNYTTGTTILLKQQWTKPPK